MLLRFIAEICIEGKHLQQICHLRIFYVKCIVCSNKDQHLSKSYVWKIITKHFSAFVMHSIDCIWQAIWKGSCLKCGIWKNCLFHCWFIIYLNDFQCFFHETLPWTAQQTKTLEHAKRHKCKREIPFSKRLIEAYNAHWIAVVWWLSTREAPEWACQDFRGSLFRLKNIFNTVI